MVQEQSDRNSNEDIDMDDEEMWFFVRRYNTYTKRNGIKHFGKNLINYCDQTNTKKERGKEKRLRAYILNVKKPSTTSRIVQISKGK